MHLHVGFRGMISSASWYVPASCLQAFVFPELLNNYVLIKKSVGWVPVCHQVLHEALLPFCVVGTPVNSFNYLN